MRIKYEEVLEAENSWEGVRDAVLKFKMKAVLLREPLILELTNDCFQPGREDKIVCLRGSTAAISYADKVINISTGMVHKDRLRFTPYYKNEKLGTS